MAEPLFGFPNRADEGTLSGGSWETSLPLSRLQDRRLSRVSRTTDASAGSTFVVADLVIPRLIRCVGLHAHNLSLDATVRVRGNSADSWGGSVDYDSGAVDAYPVIYPAGATLWGEDVGGQKPRQEDLDAGMRIDFLHFLDPTVTARFWRLDVADTGNADGYVQAGRLWLSPAWEPSSGISTGYEFGWDTSSESAETEGGGLVHLVRPRRRVADMSVRWVPEDEAMVQGQEMLRRLGTHRQFLWSFNPGDTTHLHRRSYLATMSELPMLRVPHVITEIDHTFRIREEL